MVSSELKNKGLNAVSWNILGILLKQGVTFITSIFLARLLSPSDFGLVGMATVFISFTQGFADLGLSSGLIRSKEPTESQYSSVFYFNLFVSILLALALIASSGLIAKYYSNPEIKPIVRVISYSFVIYALNSVQLAIFYKDLNIKITRLSSIISAAVTGITGIILAYAGYGVWSLVYSGLIGSIVSVIIIWKASSWRPKLLFSISDIKLLMPFGFRVFLINYLEQIYSRLDVLIIGKIFNPSILGQYFRASSFNQFVTKYTAQGLSGVFFPVISQIQDSIEDIKHVFNKSLHTICFLSFFLTGFLYLNAEPLIILLFSSKWMPAVHYFKILAFSSYVFPMTIVFNGVLLGTGNSGNQLKLELIKKGTGIAGLGIGFIFGLEGYLWSLVITATIGLLVSLYYVGKAISVTVLDNILLIYSYSVPLLFAGIIPLLLKKIIGDNLWVTLIINSVIFSLLYMTINILLKTQGYLASRSLLTEYVVSRIKRIH